jgi:hypothetical protein
VGEGLREVAERLAGRADLLGVQPEVVGVGEHLLEDRPASLTRPARVSASTYQNEQRLKLQLQQVETNTRPGTTLDELEGALRRARAAAAEAAGRVGVQVAALGTSPVPSRPRPRASPATSGWPGLSG